MIFGHTADWHIGKGRSQFDDYLDRQVTGVQAVYEDCISKDIKTVVVAGDVADNKNMSGKERDALFDILSTYDRQGILTLMIAGNHDWTEDPNRTHLSGLSRLIKDQRFPNIVVADLEPKLHEVDGTLFLLLPYQGIKDWKSLKEVVLPFTSIVPVDSPFVVVTHEYVMGYINDQGWTNKLAGVELDCSSIPEVTFWAFGDIHKKQAIAPNAWFCGGPIEHNFGEKRPKGYLVVDTDKPTKPEFVELQAVKPIITLTEIPEVWPDAHIRLKLKSNAVVDQESLPAQVHHVDWNPPEQEVEVGVDLLDGLGGYLNSLGSLTEEDVKEACELVNEIRESAGL